MSLNSEPTRAKFCKYQQAVKQRQNSINNLHYLFLVDRSENSDLSVKEISKSNHFPIPYSVNSFQEDPGYNSDTCLAMNNRTYIGDSVKIQSSAPSYSIIHQDIKFIRNKNKLLPITARYSSFGRPSVSKSRSLNFPIYRRISHRKAVFKNRQAKNKKRLIIKKVEKKPAYSQFYQAKLDLITKKKEENSIEEIGKQIQEFDLK